MVNSIPSILVVDDEELVREVTSMMVEERGWRVFTAASGIEAVNVVRKEGTIVVAAVVDFSMPDLNGYETAMKLWELNPALGMIITSGLGVIPEIEALRRSKKAFFLAKPFDDVQLQEAIRAALVKE